MDLEENNFILENRELTGNIIDNKKGKESKEIDITFNWLKKLQDLLKKESALKELCKLKNNFSLNEFSDSII